MRLSSKLDDWQAAGLIDAPTAAAIRAYDAANSRPWFIWGIVGLGLLALGLGIISLVAANWDAIPDAVKLTVHFALMIAAAGALVVAHRRGAEFATEALVFLLGALTLGGVALHAQILQLTGPLWQALALWAVLMSPIAIAVGSTVLTGAGLAGMWVALAASYWFDRTHLLGENLSIAVPFALVATALAMPPRARNLPFRSVLMLVGGGLMLGGASLAHLAWATQRDVSEVMQDALRLPFAVLVGLAACALAWRRRPHAEAMLIVGIIAMSLATTAVSIGIPHGDATGWRLVGLASFMALWGVVALLAARAGRQRLFAVAIAAIAARVFIVYLELFYSLATTGAGLIVGGLLLIALAAGWMRLTRTVAA